MKHAFRCRTCGHLHPAEYAGESSIPHSCRVCSAGAVFDPKTGRRTPQPDNWEVLADADPARLEELGLTPEDVEAHEPSRERGRARNAEQVRANLSALKKKEEDWKANQADHFAEYRKLTDRLDRIGEEINGAGDDAYAALVHERETIRQWLKDLEGKEFTPRDAAHVAELEAVLAGRVPERQGGGSVFASAREAAGHEERT
jgi:hypothetical protein